MSNVTINQLPVANSIDGSNDYLPIYTASSAATQGINRNTLLGLASAPVGLTDSQTLTNKILTSPTINGATLSGTLSGTYTIGGTPTFPSSVATLTGSQTLTNKVLTSPTINTPTITNATISADTLSGFTVSNNGTVYGMSVTGGTIGSAALAANAVTSTAIANAAVTPSKLATGASTAFNTAVTATTTSTSWVTTLTNQASAITTTVTVGANGLLLIIIQGALWNSTGGDGAALTYSLSGANTVAASFNQGTLQVTLGTSVVEASAAVLKTGLAPGSTTVTLNFQAITAGTANFTRYGITAIPL